MGGYDVQTGASNAVKGFAVGGPVGGVVGAATGFFSKKKRKKGHLEKRQKKLNKEQYAAFHGEGPLADLYSYDPEKANEVFDKTIGSKAYRDLNEKAIPSVTGQFRSQGLMQSSYAGDAVAKLARDVQESLDAQRSKYLYDTEQASKQAKREGIESYQNRSAPVKKGASKSGWGAGIDMNAIADFAVNNLPGGV